MNKPVNEKAQKGHNKVKYLNQQTRRYTTNYNLSGLHISHFYLFMHLFLHRLVLSRSLITPFLLFPSVGLSSSRSYSLFSSSSVSAPSSVVPSPSSFNSLFLVPSLFFPSYFSLFIFSLSVSPLYTLYCSVFIFPHIPLFSFLYCPSFHLFLSCYTAIPADT